VIRDANLSDIDGLCELAEYFFSKMPGGKFSEKVFRPNIRMLIKSPTARVIVAVHDGKIAGCLIGVVEKLWFSEDLIAHDVAFGVKPEVSGLYAWIMARQFIRWARSHKKVVDVTMQISSGLGDPERVGMLYEALGMKKMGGCYSLFVNGGAQS
jgi:hypothetical protein